MHAEEMIARHRQKGEQLGRMIGEIEFAPVSSAGEHANVARGRLAQMNSEWNDLQSYVQSRKQRLHEMYKFSQFIAGTSRLPAFPPSVSCRRSGPRLLAAFLPRAHSPLLLLTTHNVLYMCYE